MKQRKLDVRRMDLKTNGPNKYLIRRVHFPRNFSDKEKIILMKKLSMLPRLIDSTVALSSGQQRLNYVD